MNLLCDRDDFRELLAEAATFHGIPNQAIVEKDYFVTEALRTLSRQFGDIVIFKGGTSLSKGWKLIQRFSEDIDLYVDSGSRGKKATNSLLKEIEEAINAHARLELDESLTQRIDGSARATRYRYPSAGSNLGAISPMVLVEAGIQSGTVPTEKRELTSLLSEFLDRREIRAATDDREPFVLCLLHFSRTFVEKLFAIHDKVERGVLEQGKELGTYARHYYDLSQLAKQEAVIEMLSSDAYAAIARDYGDVTSRFFANQRLPARLELSCSRALFPDAALRATLGSEYEAQCRALCYGEYPPFESVLECFEEIRRFLVAID